MEHPVLSFLYDYLSDLQIQHFVTDGHKTTMSDLDLGLRSSILKLTDQPPSQIIKALDNSTLYHITDYYNCNYTFFQFPKRNEILFIGPYLLEEVTDSDLYHQMDTLQIPSALLPQLRDYYNALPYIPEKHHFHLLLLHTYQTVFSIETASIRHLDLKELECQDDFLRQHEYQVTEDPILSMQLLEKRYAIEDTLLDAISQGNVAKALSASESIRSSRIAPRTKDVLRNAKNFMITFNSLLRRAAYCAGVHPFYIDAVSSNYARLIEQSRTLDEVNAIAPFQVRSYCDLVTKRSMASYSEPIRHILVTIDASLTADLSLKRFAAELFLNTSYLSALFKKELGMPLTDYVNKSKISYSQKLLKSTTLSIQDIASQSGIPDIHYFTRLFRRETGVSPREWRNHH